MVANYYKIPLLTTQEVKTVETECSEDLASVMKQMRTIIDPCVAHLNEFINKELPVEAEEAQAPGQKNLPAA